MKQWIEYAVENYRGKNSFGFQLVKDLKERQIIQAIERYARGVKQEEVVALMDTSVFRSGKTGFLLTDRYLYSDKYKEDGPVSLMFLKDVSVRPENNSCCVLTFKDDSTRDVDISVFLDVVDVLRMIIEQRNAHEQDLDDTKADGSAAGEQEGKEGTEEQKNHKNHRKDHARTASGMKDMPERSRTSESRTVFEDSAEEFLRTVREEAPVKDIKGTEEADREAKEAESALKGAVTAESAMKGIGVTESAMKGIAITEGAIGGENFTQGLAVTEGPVKDIFRMNEAETFTEDFAKDLVKGAPGADETAEQTGYSGISVEAVRPAGYGELEEPRDEKEQGVSGLPIEIIPVDDFEESGESEESREQRWLAEFSQSGAPGDLILDDDPEPAQGQEDAEEDADANEEPEKDGREQDETVQAEESFEELLGKAEAGDSAAMYQAAELYFTGEQAVRDTKPCEDAQQAQNAGKIESVDLVQDVKQAMRWFRESARLEYVPAMLKMMHFYREGEQVKKNYTLSLSWAKKAAATGDQRGQYALVDSYLYGLDGKQDTGAGLALLSKMAEQGDESAKRTADDVLNKIREAKERFDAGIKNPSTASGYYEMGMYCLKGDGFYNYPKEAVRYLKKAAEKEHVHAEYQLALAYHTGDGVKKDEDECIRWLEKAAAKSHKEAGELLAELQEKRRIRQEKAEFKNHLRQAEKGDAYAQSKTAELYLVGIGVKQDIQKGIEWYEKASETDEGYAARQLAKLYSEGEFVPVDPEKAAYWRMVGGVLDEL